MRVEASKPTRGGGQILAREAAREAGVGVQTLHYYERRSLIPPPPRSRGGYRLYTPEILERVRFIRKAQALGFSLDEIGEILNLAAEGAKPCGRVRVVLAKKLVQVDRRLEELRGFRAELAELLDRSPDLSAREAAVCSILEEAPGPRVAPGISPFLRSKRRAPSAR